MSATSKKTKNNLITFTLLTVLFVLLFLALILITTNSKPSDDAVLGLDITSEVPLEEADAPQVLEDVLPEGEDYVEEIQPAVEDAEAELEAEVEPLEPVYYDN